MTRLEPVLLDVPYYTIEKFVHIKGEAGFVVIALHVCHRRVIKTRMASSARLLEYESTLTLQHISDFSSMMQPRADKARAPVIGPRSIII